MSIENDGVTQEILDLSFEDKFANSLYQIHSFIDNLIIETCTNDLEKGGHVKNLLNLKLFIDNSLFEYKVKSLLLSRIEDKKKEKESLKELESQKDLLEQGQ
jgi:hypothetical protein